MMLNYCAVFIVLLSAVIAASGTEDRLPRVVLPTHYDLHFRTEAHTGTGALQGTAQISIEVVEPTRKIVLHSDGLKIQNVSLFDAIGNVLNDPEIGFDKEKEQLILSCDDELKQGRYELSIVFETSTSERWNFLPYDDDEKGNRKFVLVMRFPTSARSAFPCFDEPNLKATFSLKVTHHRNLSVDSNMPLIGLPRPLDKDYVVSHFKKSPKMSTYSLTFIVTEGYKSFGSASHSVKAHASVINKTKESLRLAEDLMDVLDQHTGLPYNEYMPKLTHMVIPTGYTWWPNEHWGLIIHDEDSIMSPLSIGHKLAHMWFGGLVTPEWSDIIWLKEGFAELYASYALDLARPTERWMEWFNVKIKVKGMDQGRYYDSITDPGGQYHNYRDRVFERAAGVLNMIRQMIGDYTWQQVIQSFLKNHRLATVVPSDLYTELEKFTEGSELFPKNLSLEKIMNTWMTNYRVPELTVKRQYDEGTITVTQNQAEPDMNQENWVMQLTYEDGRLPKQNQTWIIPYNYAQASDASFDVVGPIHWLAEPSVVISTNATSNEWILLGKRHFGLYHINYDEQNWKLLAQALRKNISCMPSENRAQLLMDAFYFHVNKMMNESVLYELLAFLSDETDSLVWYTALPVIDSFKQKQRAAKYQNYFQFFLEHITKRYFNSIITTLATSSSDLSVRKSIIFLACQIGNPDCLSAAYTKFQQAYWANSSDLPSDDDGIHVFCFGSYQASDREFRWLLQQFEAANGDKRKQLMTYLACTKKPERLRVLIKLVNDVSDDDNVNLLNELYQGLQMDLSEAVTWRLVKVLQDRKFAEQIDIFIIRLLLSVMNDRIQSEQAERAMWEIRNRFQDGLREIGIEDWDTYRKSELEDPNGTINKFLEGHFLTT